ncbi:MAG: hypothetical protein J5864_08600 [Oscillospiraceae bacterium]|nr:hypothetical protein [Oscillospiraceae bacterium]
MSQKNISENELSKAQIILSAVLKIIVIISAVTGTLISALAGSDDFMGGRYVSS